MKISEAIKQLEVRLEVYGDLELVAVVRDEDYFVAYRGLVLEQVNLPDTLGDEESVCALIDESLLSEVEPK